MKKIYNLVIVGAGPAGLSAAITASSEMPDVLLLDSGKRDETRVRKRQLGGQATGSTSIENYAGFPDGITGLDLMCRFEKQALKFQTEIACPARAESIVLLNNGNKIVHTKEGGEYTARAVLVTSGLSYQKLAAPGVEDFLGKGVLYGAPTSSPHELGSCTVCVVGAANSAGQAVMHLAQNPDIKIKVLVRNSAGIEAQMSQYLVDRIKSCPQVEVLNTTTVSRLHGTDTLECIEVKQGEDVRKIRAQHLFIFIGAAPKTEWLSKSLSRDERGFLITGRDHKDGLIRLPFETSIPGVFAAGDVRVNSVKRVAAAAGDGAKAISAVHEYLVPKK